MAHEMSNGLKTRLTLINGKPFQWPDSATPVERARQRYGKPFAHERGTQHRHEQGPAYWTAERIADLSAANERARRERLAHKAQRGAK